MLTHCSKLISRFIFIVLSIFLLSCTALSPPRLEKTRVPLGDQLDGEAAFYAAPTPTGDPIQLSSISTDESQSTLNPVLTVWVNETSDAHQQVLEEMTKVLDAEYGLHLEFVLVSDDRLPDLVEGAAAVNRLPDVIIHPVEYSAGWAAQGVFDVALAESIIESLGADTFTPDSLQSVLINDQSAAIPIDGHKQILIYRKDWFDALSLREPDNYRAILQGARAIYRSETLSAQTGISSTLLSGLVVPTESDLISTHQVFEHFANANGCRLVDEKGEVIILSPECLDTFEFYRELVNGYSPNDIQTDTSAINAYLSGRTGMIFGSPDLLVDIAGLSADLMPSCPECLEDDQFLPQNSGIRTRIIGRANFGDSVEFGRMTLMGFTHDAQPELAERFATYWFNQGYQDWLGLEPAARVPMRLGTQDNPTEYIDLWYELPLTITTDGETLTDIFGQEITSNLAHGIASTPRWGIDSEQGDLIATVYKQNIIAIVLQEMLSGYFTSNQAIVASWERVIELVPGYQFETELPDFLEPPNEGSE